MRNDFFELRKTTDGGNSTEVFIKIISRDVFSWRKLKEKRFALSDSLSKDFLASANRCFRR